MKILYVDMDDVLCNYSTALESALQLNPDIEFPQSVPGFFECLKPLPGAVETYSELAIQYDVYILSAPSVPNPLSYTEMRLWAENHLGMEMVSKLILASNKGLLKGDYLIDDYDSGRGQENFEGELIHFGSQRFPDWGSVAKYLL